MAFSFAWQGVLFMYSSASLLTIVFNLRWVALAGLLVVFAPALKLGWIQPDVRLPFILLIAFSAALNAASVLAHKVQVIRVSQAQLLAQLGFDLAVLCGLLWMTGGAWNPFIVLTLVHAALAAMLLNGLHLLIYAFTYFWATTALYSNPMLPRPVFGQGLPSVILYPIHMLASTSLMGLVGWLSYQLDKKRLEIELTKDDARKHEHMRVYGVIAAGFSHEFATPLSTLQLRLNRLLRGHPQVAQSDDFQVAADAARACQSVLKKMIRQQGQLEPCTIEEVDLNEQLRIIKEKWSVSGCDLQIETAKSPVTVRTTVTNLRQVILDLVDNAYRAKSDGPIVVRSHRNDQRGEVELHVDDQGPGVPQIVRDHLGEPFFTTRENGHGLGLFHAHSFAKAMGGQLRITDRTGGGSTVSLTFPSRVAVP